MIDNLVFKRDIKIDKEIYPLKSHILDEYIPSGSIIEIIEDPRLDSDRVKFKIDDKVHYMNRRAFNDSVYTLSEYMHYKLSKLI